jgi:hypothetical protein
MSGFGGQLRAKGPNTDLTDVEVTVCKPGRRRRESRKIKCRSGRVAPEAVIDAAQRASNAYVHIDGKRVRQ